MKAQKTERLHALDSLRAIMMMLGVVLHSANTYKVSEAGPGWPLRDPESTSIILDFIDGIVHGFRMPIFFVIAGFFASLLFYERSYSKMIKNRINRILLPFIVFLFIMWPLVKMTFNYSNSVFDGTTNAFEITIANFTTIASFIPPHTFHLWFLYYLVMYSITSFLLGILFKKLPELSGGINHIFSYIIQKPILKVIVFSGITLLLLLFMNRSWVATSTSFVPDFNTYIFYAYFYFFGWILFKSKAYLNTFLKHDWLFTILAVILFTTYFLIDSDALSLEVKMAIKSVNVWLFTFGFTGLFIRYASKHSAIMRYVSDSAYWVYLLHLPLTALLPGFLSGFAIPAFFKFLIVMTGTTIICFVTYHYLVRATFIGKFLNGRSYTRSIKDIKPEQKINPQIKVASS